jgi:hypothetical protein
MSSIILPTNYYQQFDADRNLDVPAEGYGGWKKAELELNPQRTAVVVMHAWDCGTWDCFPGWHRAVEYIPRSYTICRSVLPELLAAVRSSEMKLFHVVKPDSHYYKEYPGYKKAIEIAGIAKDTNSLELIEPDRVSQNLFRFRSANSFPGLHNQADITNGNKKLDFPNEVKPIGDEGIAENAHQLYALCKESGINHLIYTGFAINGCLWSSPGGMFDMQKRGMLCSTIRQAVTAIENKETARNEQAKELALWYVALMFGFVYDLNDFIHAIKYAARLEDSRN